MSLTTVIFALVLSYYSNLATGDDAVSNSFSLVKTKQHRAEASSVTKAIASLLLQGPQSAAWQTSGHGGKPATRKAFVDYPRLSSGLPTPIHSRAEKRAWMTTVGKPAEAEQRLEAAPTVTEEERAKRIEALRERIKASCEKPAASDPSMRTAVLERDEKETGKRFNPKKAESFEELGVKSKALLANLKEHNFVTPLEMQKLAFHSIRDSMIDIGLVAEAGSGKTLAYLVPLIDTLMGYSRKGYAARARKGLPQKDHRKHVVHVILPTHDLAEQAMRVASTLCAHTGLKVAFADSRKARDADLILGTIASQAFFLTGSAEGRNNKAGKLAASYAHTKGRKLKLSLSSRQKKGENRQAVPEAVEETDAFNKSSDGMSRLVDPQLCVTVVLDEADLQFAGAKAVGATSGNSAACKILDVLRPRTKKDAEAAKSGHYDKLKPRIIAVSATMPGQGKSTVGQFLEIRLPEIDWIRSDGCHKPVSTLKQEYKDVSSSKERDETLISVIKGREGRTLVFANTAKKAKDLEYLLSRVVPRSQLFLFTPEMKPHERDASLGKFSARDNNPILVCSGAGARGLDLPDVALVVEYQMAKNIIDHVHRVGRTARAGKEGRSVSLVSPGNPADQKIVKEIERCRKGGWKFL